MKKMKILVPVLFVSLLLTMVLVLPTASSVTAAENLAANGDLEQGSTTGWEISNAAIDSSVKYAGNYSLKLTATSAYSGAAYKTIPVRKNATVTVSFYYRYDSNPGSGKTYHVYTYQGADASAGVYSNADATFTIPSGCDSITTWKQVSYTFNSGNYNNIYLKFCPGSNGSSTCYIDDLVVTAEGGDEEVVAPYLTSFGTKMNRPQNAAANIIKQGGFESTENATWNTSGFLSNGVQVVEDPTAPEGNHSLFFDSSAVTKAEWHGFVVKVEKNTQYTFSAWVKSPRLSANNNATATFGVATNDPKFLVYEPYQGDGYGTALRSSTTLQLTATSPDDEWHLRSVTFYSGTHTELAIALYGAKSQLYLDDIALYKSSNGIEYISPLRTDVVSAGNNSGNKYCADADSLIEGIYMTTNDAQLTWSKNPAWRNGFLSFVESGDAHGTALQYTASAKTNLKLNYIDWIDVKPNTSYTLTLDVKRTEKGNGYIALLDDNYESPQEFYTIKFSSVDTDWVTYSITFTTQSYSRIGFAIVDGGGCALIDEVRLFETAKGIADEPSEPTPEPAPTLTPQANGTSVMEMSSATLGVAFRFEQEGFRIYANGKGEVDLSSATVIPYGDGEAYTLLRMGAVVTNQASIGQDADVMNLSGVDGITVANVPVVYVWNVSASGCSYAVRVINVPQSAADTLIYARPYYVFEKDGEEIVVYGDIVYRSYNG